MTPHLPFRSLYLETSTLYESEWPHVSVRLEQLLSVAKELAIRVMLPAPVAHEREEQWLREAEKDADAHNRAWQVVTKRLAHVGVTQECPAIPSKAEMRRLYKTIAQSAKREWSILDAPYTSRGVQELFRLAIMHERPFKEEGRGFQDAVIYLSVIDHMSCDPNSGPAILVANDRDYSSINLETIARNPKEIDLKIVPLDRATEILKSHLIESERRDWDNLQNLAKRKLEEIGPELEDFLRRNVTPENLLPMGTWLEVYRVKLVGIDGVNTPNPKDLKSEQEFEISATLIVSISATIPQLIKLGFGTGKSVYIADIAANAAKLDLNHPKPTVATLQTIPANLELRASAILHDSEIGEITPVSVKVIPIHYSIAGWISPTSESN